MRKHTQKAQFALAAILAGCSGSYRDGLSRLPEDQQSHVQTAFDRLTVAAEKVEMADRTRAGMLMADADEAGKQRMYNMADSAIEGLPEVIQNLSPEARDVLRAGINERVRESRGREADYVNAQAEVLKRLTDQFVPQKRNR